MPVLIQIRGLSKTYESEGVKTRAVCGVTFDIEKGEFVAIMGPSGSGKSTLMQILGFLDRPTEGKFYFEEKDTKDFSDDQLAEIRNQKTGFVFQSFNLLVRTSVYENVELPLLYDQRHLSKKEKDRKIKFALEAVGMTHRTDYGSNQLSGGEKQRVAIARALVNDPEVVFADEPTGNLDSKSGLAVMKILQRLNQEGRTIILVTHENYTAQHAKRILKVKDGKIVSDRGVLSQMDAEKEKELKK
jgi:putative ABC transport system ATP-binding protein